MATKGRRGKLRTRDIISAWVRSSGRCHWCREALEPGDVVMDHYMPVALGGTDDSDNIVTSCRPCNFAKRDRHPRIWELRMHEGVPLCVATELHAFEEGASLEASKVFYVGAAYEDLENGKRRVVKLPLAMGNCDNPRCPDCNDTFGGDRLYEKEQ